MDWELVYGTAKIYETKHIVTYGGGPEGGFVYFTSRQTGRGGWYKWHHDWFKKAVYTKVVEGLVAFLMHADGSKKSRSYRTVGTQQLTWKP